MILQSHLKARALPHRTGARPAAEDLMRPLLALATLIDRTTAAIGRGVAWLILLAILVSAGNAGRYRSVVTGCKPSSSASSSTTSDVGMDGVAEVMAPRVADSRGAGVPICRRPSGCDKSA